MCPLYPSAHHYSHPTAVATAPGICIVTPMRNESGQSHQPAALRAQRWEHLVDSGDQHYQQVVRKVAMPVRAWRSYLGRHAIDQLQWCEAQIVCATLVTGGLAALFDIAVHQGSAHFAKTFHDKGGRVQ